jgi:hypothetical protein
VKHAIGCMLAAAGLWAAPAHAQSGAPWQRAPEIAVIGAEADPRIALVDEALSYWNRILEESGSSFRLGPAVRHVMPVSEEGLQLLSLSLLNRRGAPVQVPQSLRGLPGELNIVLADSNFISFAGPFDPDGKRVVGIKGAGHYPLTLPNVARNLIAHELGHAIGLGHNADPAMLMCGRPAPCRPDVYQSTEARFFALTDEERRRLRAMYPIR